jgi:hypothetical protein
MASLVWIFNLEYKFTIKIWIQIWELKIERKGNMKIEKKRRKELLGRYFH